MLVVWRWGGYAWYEICALIWRKFDVNMVYFLRKLCVNAGYILRENGVIFA